MDLESIKNCITVLECRFCGNKIRPWQQGTIYKCVDWNKPKEERSKYVLTYCTECGVLDPFVSYEDPEFKILSKV